MADDDPPMIQVQRSTAVRVGIAVAVLVALGIGFAVGYAVHSPAKSGQAGGTTTTVVAHVHNTIIPSRAITTTTTTMAPTTTTNPDLAVLAPATTPPVSDECSIPINYSADGSPYPATCPSGGGVNKVAWADMANTYPTLLALGASATEAQVFQTMCNLPNVVGGEVSTTATMAATYYGWSFASALGNWYPADPAYCSG